MPRSKGTPNKRSKELLNALEKEHDFHVVDELLEVYMYNKCVLVYLADKVNKNIQAGNIPTYQMDEAEVEMYNSCNKHVLDVLMKLLTYLYPKLKAMEIGTGTSDKVVFNINTAPDLQQIKPQPSGVEVKPTLQ